MAVKGQRKEGEGERSCVGLLLGLCLGLMACSIRPLPSFSMCFWRGRREKGKKNTHSRRSLGRMFWHKWECAIRFNQSVHIRILENTVGERVRMKWRRLVLETQSWWLRKRQDIMAEDPGREVGEGGSRQTGHIPLGSSLSFSLCLTVSHNHRHFLADSISSWSKNQGVWDRVKVCSSLIPNQTTYSM